MLSNSRSLGGWRLEAKPIAYMSGFSNTEKLAIEVIADRIQHGELPPSALSISFQVLSDQLAGD